MTKSQRNVSLFLMIVAAAIGTGVALDRYVFTSSQTVVAWEDIEVDTLFADIDTLDTTQKRRREPLYYAQEERRAETFPFDPNTADSTTLLRLGLAPYQVRNIYKYRAKGGRYHRVEDFKRVYGMTPELWDRLQPCVRIDKAFRYYEADSSQLAEMTERSGHQTADDTVAQYPRQEKFTELVQVDVNAADSDLLKKIPQIASYRARKILEYRERLGGFAEVAQLAEIKNLPPEVLEWFKVETGVYRKINVNTASFTQMSRHPYIGYGRAKVISDYRNRQGAIKDLRELSLMEGFGAEEIQRILPYIEY